MAFNIPTVGGASTLLGGASGAYSALVTILKPNRRGIYTDPSLGPVNLLFQAEAMVEEQHTDEMQITDHPTEFGATISDHTFKLPSTVILTYGWSNGSTGLVDATLSAIKTVSTGTASLAKFFGTEKVNQIYGNLVALQTERTVFSIQTGRRYYPSMVLKSLQVVTDKDTENALIVRAECREIKIVQAIQTNDLDASTQASPVDTASCGNAGTKNATVVQGS